MRMTVAQVRAGLYEASWAPMIDVRVPDVLAHLAAERRLAEKLIESGGYRALVEVGCADGSLLLPAAARQRLHYLGIDLAAGAVRAAREALRDLAATGSVTQADAAELPGLTAGLPRPLLVAFPFNVIGILPDPRSVLADCRDAEVLVLTYDTGEQAAALRSRYYREAGFIGSMTRDQEGVHFAAGDFASSVFEPPVITGWLRELGFEVSVHRYGVAGLAYLGERS